MGGSEHNPLEGVQPIIRQNLCQKLLENERNWTQGERASLVPPWICQCVVTNIGTGNGGVGSNIITPCVPHRITCGLETNAYHHQKVQNKGMLHFNRLNNVVN